MKKLEFSAALCVSLVIIAIFVSIGFTNPANSLATAFNAGKNKNYGAYILKKDVILKLDKNYDLKAYITESMKILSQRGIDKYSEIIIPFSEKYQKIKLLYAYTLLNGMFKVPVGKHAVNVVSPSFAINYPAYSNIKYFTVSMPAVEVGSIINFSYEIDNFKPLIKNGVFYTNYFSYTIPAKKVSFTLTYPAGLRLNLYLHKLNKSMVSRKVIYIKNQKYFRLSASLENISAIKKESYMPPVKNLRKYIALSTYTSWGKLLKKINMMFVKSEKSSKKNKNNIEKFVQSAVKKGKGKSQKQKAVSIYNDFVKSFRYEGIGYGTNGYNPEPAATTFGYGYGDSKSLVSLLISMLKIEKINAYPVLISSLNTAELNIKNVSPEQFDSVIVGLTLKERGRTFHYYLYPDSSSYKAFKIPYSLAGRKGVMLLSDGQFKFITLPSEKPKQNEKIFKFKGQLSKNGDLKGNISVNYKGVYSNSERQSLKNIDNYNKKIKMFNFLYDFIPGANVENFEYENINNVNKNIKLKIKFSDKNYGVLNGDKLEFHAVIPVDMRLIHLVLRQKRRYPLIIGYPFEHIAEINIKLPEKSDIYYLPDPLKFGNKAGSAYSDCSFSKSAEKLKCYYKFKSKTSAISVKAYKKYRQIIRNYLEYLKNYFIVVSSIYFY